MAQAFTVDARSTRSPEVIFDLLARSANWPEWSLIDEAIIQRQGEKHADGVGSVREFRTGKNVIVEEITRFERPERISYRLLSGLAVRDYHANIDLEAVEGGTAISWQTSFRSRVPGMGWLYALALKNVTRKIVRAAISKVEA